MATITDHDILIVLETARNSIAQSVPWSDNYDPETDGPCWDFGMWTSCTCGHIYGAAANAMPDGRPDSDEITFHSAGAAIEQADGRLYRRTLERIGEVLRDHPDFRDLEIQGVALDVLPPDLIENPAYLVSDLTAAQVIQRKGGQSDNQRLRTAALRLLDAAIERIQREHREAMAACAAATPQPTEAVAA